MRFLQTSTDLQCGKRVTCRTPNVNIAEGLGFIVGRQQTE